MADYTLDWASVHLDGHNTLSGSDGSVGVDISTPANGDHDSWSLGHIEGKTELVSDCVDDPTKVTVTFDHEVENVSFELFDIDSDNCYWDDRVTVIARDADGNIVPVDFSDLAHHHHVNGNTVDTSGNVSSGVEGSGDADSVTVSIPGPIVSLEIIHDNGSGAHSSGTVGVSDLHFDKTETGDGIVSGTGGDDVIDVFYEGDPEGDKIDADDALLPGEVENDDIVLAGDGDDTGLGSGPIDFRIAA